MSDSDDSVVAIGDNNANNNRDTTTTLHDANQSTLVFTQREKPPAAVVVAGSATTTTNTNSNNDDDDNNDDDCIVPITQPLPIGSPPPAAKPPPSSRHANEPFPQKQQKHQHNDKDKHMTEQQRREKQQLLLDSGNKSAPCGVAGRNKKERTSTVNVVGGSAAAAAASSSQQPQPSASSPTRRVPRIIAEEKERRERAAQEMLWLAPTVDDDPDDIYNFSGGVGVSGESIDAFTNNNANNAMMMPTTSSSTGLPTAAAAASGASSGAPNASAATPPHALSSLSSMPPRRMVVEVGRNGWHHQQPTTTGSAGASTTPGNHAPPPPMSIHSLDNLSQSAGGAGTPDSSQQYGQVQQHRRTSAAPSPFGGIPTAASNSSSSNNPLAGMQGAPSASAEESPTQQLQQQQQQQSHSQQQIGKQQRGGHDRAGNQSQSYEYFVKTEHGAARASVKFDSQQECMQLTEAIGHGRIGSLAATVVAPTAAAAPTAGSGLPPPHPGHGHTRSTSVSHARATSLSLQRAAGRAGAGVGGRPLSRPVSTQDLSASGPIAFSNEHGDSNLNNNNQGSNDFTPEQLAAINAFDDGRGRNVRPAARRVSLPAAATDSMGAGGGLPTSTSSTALDQQLAGASAATTTHNRGASTTFYSRMRSTGSGKHIPGSGGGGAKRGSIGGGHSSACLDALHHLHKTQQQQHQHEPDGIIKSDISPPEAEEGDGGKKAARTTAALQNKNDSDDEQDPHVLPSPNDVMYAGFGPRDKLEIPQIPYDTAWKQHTLPSVRVELGPWWTIFMLCFVAITCIPVGSVLMSAATSAQRVDIRYDNVLKYRHPAPINTTATGGTTTTSAPADTAEYLWSTDINGVVHRQGRRSFVRFNLTETLTAPVLMSYGISNFFHNHLNVQQSKSYVQLAGGKIVSELDVANCNPILTPGSLKETVDEKTASAKTEVYKDGALWKLYRDFQYHPCGSLPWSKFNDSFNLWRIADHSSVVLSAAAAPTLPVTSSGSSTTLPLLNSSVAGVSLVCNTSAFTPAGFHKYLTASENPCEKAPIAVRSDAAKFKDPNFENNDGVLWTNPAHRHYNTTDVYLEHGWYADEPGHELPNVHDLDFQVWMRIAPLPTFRKLLRVINVDMPAGQYQLEIDEYFDSTSFHGEKFIALESRSALGGRNYGLPIVYLVAGGLSLFLALATLIQHLLCRRNEDDQDDGAVKVKSD